MKTRKPQVIRLENGARVSPVECQVIRKIEREDERRELWWALGKMVEKDGVKWTMTKLAAEAKLPVFEVGRVMRKLGVC